MNALILILIPFGMCLQQIAKKAYHQKKGGPFTFSAASAVFSLAVYFFTSGGDLQFSLAILPYSVAFAACFAAALIGSFLAIKHGPLSISSLIFQYSLLIPAFYGFFALGDPVKITLIVGIALLAVSLFLVNKKDKNEPKKISFRWIVFLLIGFLGNGLCSTVQKIQQMHFAGQYKSEFMIVAMAICAVSLFGTALATERSTISVGIKKGWMWFLFCGLANGGVNYGIMLLTNRLPSSVMFPIVSAGSTVLTCLVSWLFYKERLTKIQTVGLILGILAIVAMNL